MSDRSHGLGELQQLVLFSLLRLGDDAYGVTVRREIEERTGRSVSAGAVYTTLGRLERHGLVASHLAAGDPRRAGRRRKHYRLLPAGAAALHRAYRAVSTMARGQVATLTELLDGSGPRGGS